MLFLSGRGERDDVLQVCSLAEPPRATPDDPTAQPPASAKMLSLFLQDAAVSSAPYFFGYMGAAFALVFASASLCPRSHPPPPNVEAGAAMCSQRRAAREGLGGVG